jgi:hypothetical protein
MVLLALFMLSCQESLEEKAAREARLYTEKNCPARIDENLMIDSLNFEAATHTLHYYYTLTGRADTVGILCDSIAREPLLLQLKNTTMMGAYKEKDYNFTYTYRSQKHPDVVVYEITLTAADYKLGAQ